MGKYIKTINNQKNKQNKILLDIDLAHKALINTPSIHQDIIQLLLREQTKNPLCYCLKIPHCLSIIFNIK